MRTVTRCVLLAAAMLACSQSAYNPAVPGSTESVRLQLIDCLVRACHPAADQTAPAETESETSSSVFLFSTGTVSGTSANNRGAADAACNGARVTFNFPENSCANVRVLASYSAVDSFGNMAAAYGIPTARAVRGPTGILVANDWSDLTDGNIAATLASTGVAASSYWTFSVAPAGYDATNGPCTGTNGFIGSHTQSGGGWVSSTTFSCGTGFRLLCVCF